MFDERLRRAKDRALAPAAARLGRVPPLAITAAGLAVGLACAGAALAGDVPTSLGLWATNRVLDGLDGAVARAHGTTTDRGGYLDLVADFVTYAAIPVAQVAGSANPGALAVPLGLLLGSYYVNAVSWLALGAILDRRDLGNGVAPARETTVAMPTGLIEGAETVAFVAACLAWPGSLGWLFTGFGTLVIATAAQRVAWAWRALRPAPTEGRGGSGG